MLSNRKFLNYGIEDGVVGGIVPPLIGLFGTVAGIINIAEKYSIYT